MRSTLGAAVLDGELDGEGEDDSAMTGEAISTVPATNEAMPSRVNLRWRYTGPSVAQVRVRIVQNGDAEVSN